MNVREFTKEHQKNIVDEARKCALATIHEVYEEYEEHHGCLSDVDIDKIRDALQSLMYIKSLE